jgi:hypothetical protein
MFLHLVLPTGNVICDEVEDPTHFSAEDLRRDVASDLEEEYRDSRLVYRGCDMLDLHPTAPLSEWGMPNMDHKRIGAFIQVVGKKEKMDCKHTSVGHKSKRETTVKPSIANTRPEYVRKAKKHCLQKMKHCLQKMNLGQKKKQRTRHRKITPNHDNCVLCLHRILTEATRLVKKEEED